MKNILIVDNDLGFVCWLGEVLIGPKYQPWPACSVSDAMTIVGSKPRVPLDLLIVNPSLRGVSRLIARYRRRLPHLEVIALGPHPANALPGVTAWRERPEATDDTARRNWFRAIDSIVQRSQKRTHGRKGHMAPGASFRLIPTFG